MNMIETKNEKPIDYIIPIEVQEVLNQAREQREASNKDSPEMDLQGVLKSRRLKELVALEEAWLKNGGKGRKPAQLKAIRCSIVLQEYISFGLFDLEENTRLAMYIPKEGIYTKNETVIRRVISWLEPSLNANGASDVIYHLKNSSQLIKKTDSRYLIPVQNGVFNLRTKKLEPFTPEYVFTSKISTSYIERAKMPEIDGWNIEEWMQSIACKDEQIVTLLWQVINDSLNGNYSRKKAIFLIGEGNNGKGTYQELITNLIGLQNIATIKVDEFDQRFRLGVLEGKTAVIGDDVQANVYIDNSSNFNSVVTGDVVSVELKNKDPYNAVFRCSVIQSTNGMPKFKNKSNGTIRRLVIVPFQANFNGESENTRIKDEYVRNKEVLQYVLHKAVHMDFEKFTVPQASLRELEVFKQDNDPLLDFKLSVFDEWEIQRVPKFVVYGFYKKFCNENGYKFLSDRKFHKDFRKLVENEWDSEGQSRYNYETLLKQLGDLDELSIGFPNKNSNQKSYEKKR